MRYEHSLPRRYRTKGCRYHNETEGCKAELTHKSEEPGRIAGYVILKIYFVVKFE
jgi:hypothetical protein